ncbi:integrase recombinase xerD homolog [Paramuricea clavata]|uniref:Integrase recombinase xerD homolog n=1 Tax=Paramuricea clavata TaxID=317549 RepID=A0A7D9IZA8_PARCT|nr:integrase recombinase xerD homolog [Paramuricea clavata]
MIKAIVDKYATSTASLQDLRLAYLCTLGFAAFLRFDGLNNIVPLHLTITSDYLKIFIPHAKNDVYREGDFVYVSLLKDKLPCSDIGKIHDECGPLTEQQTRSLAKGLNYNTKDADKLDYVADLESALKNSGLTDETKEHIRQITTNLHNKRPVKLDIEEQKAIKDLQDNDEIIILTAEKGRMTVIMNKSDYIDR